MKKPSINKKDSSITPSSKNKKNLAAYCPQPSQFVFNNNKVLTPRGKNVEIEYQFNINPVMEEELRFKIVPEIDGERSSQDLSKIDEMFMEPEVQKTINLEYQAYQDYKRMSLSRHSKSKSNKFSDSLTSSSLIQSGSFNAPTNSNRSTTSDQPIKTPTKQASVPADVSDKMICPPQEFLIPK